MSNKTNVSTPAKHGAPATTYNPITPPASPSTASPVQGAASAPACPDCKGTRGHEKELSSTSGTWVPCPTCCPPDAATSSASGAKGAAVKPWQERAKEAGDFPAFSAEGLVKHMQAEIVDWRALAERAQAAQPSGAVALADRLAKLSDEAEAKRSAEENPHMERIYLGAREAYRVAADLARATPAPEQEAAQVGAVPALAELREQVKEMQAAAYTYGDYSQEAVRVALDGVIDAIDSLAAPVAQEAEQPEGDVMRPKPCRNEIINSGAGAYPRSCPRCGIVKDCPAGVVAHFGHLGAANTDKGGEA